MKVLKTIAIIVAHIFASPIYILGAITVGVTVFIYWIFGIATPKQVLKRGVIKYIVKHICPFINDIDIDKENSQKTES